MRPAKDRIAGIILSFSHISSAASRWRRMTRALLFLTRVFILRAMPWIRRKERGIPNSSVIVLLSTVCRDFELEDGFVNSELFLEIIG